VQCFFDFWPLFGLYASLTWFVLPTKFLWRMSLLLFSARFEVFQYCLHSIAFGVGTLATLYFVDILLSFTALFFIVYFFVASYPASGPLQASIFLPLYPCLGHASGTYKM
jgi:hypothetical protein